MTCPGTQFLGGQHASTCLGIQSPGGCHASTCLGICTLTWGCLALRLQQNWVRSASERLTTHENRKKPKGCGTVPCLSDNSGVQQELHCLSGKAKRGPPKVYQSGLRLLQGTGDFKGQIPVPICIRYRDKVTTVTAIGPCCLFNEMVQTTTNTFYNREQEREAKAQEREKRKRQGMHSCWPPSREALWQTPSP